MIVNHNSVTEYNTCCLFSFYFHRSVINTDSNNVHFDTCFSCSVLSDVCFSDTESFHASLWEEQRRKKRTIAFDVSESENEVRVINRADWFVSICISHS